MGMFKFKIREHFSQMPKSYQDIPGNKADTLKKSIITERNLNPLDPAYNMPGHSEPLESGNAAYGEEGCSMARRPTTTQNARQFFTQKPSEPIENPVPPARS